jgi:molybdate-binding protein
VPLGEFQREALQQYSQWLQPTHRLVLLATRRQGLMVAPGNPKRVRGLADLVRGDVRFVNRQTGSGTRMLLDLLLRKEQLQAQHIEGYDTSEYTHAAVAAFVASGMADAGFGVETPAKRFGLEFLPLASERYFFACSAEFLSSATMTRVLASLRSPELKAAINALAGYDGMQAGTVMTVSEAFPERR